MPYLDVLEHDCCENITRIDACVSLVSVLLFYVTFYMLHMMKFRVQSLG